MSKLYPQGQPGQQGGKGPESSEDIPKHDEL